MKHLLLFFLISFFSNRWNVEANEEDEEYDDVTEDYDDEEQYSDDGDKYESGEDYTDDEEYGK